MTVLEYVLILFICSLFCFLKGFAWIWNKLPSYQSENAFKNELTELRAPQRLNYFDFRDTSNEAWNSKTALKYCGVSHLSQVCFLSVLHSSFLCCDSKSLFKQGFVSVSCYYGLTSQGKLSDILLWSRSKQRKPSVQTYHYRFLAALCQWSVHMPAELNKQNLI